MRSERDDTSHSARGPQPSTLITTLLLFLGFSALYIAISRGVFVYGDDVLMFQVTEGLVERGGPAVTSPSDRGDVAVSVPGKGERNYAKYGLGQSLVAIPAYVASDLVLEPLLPLAEQRDNYGNLRTGTRLYGTALTDAVLGGATVAVLFLLARHVGYSERTGLVLAGLLAAGTLLAHYAATFLSEPLSGLCLLLTVYGIARAAVGNRGTGSGEVGGSPIPDPYRWLILSGFCAGLALATRVANGVALIAPGLWMVWLAWWMSRTDRRAAVRMLAAWGVPLAAWLASIGYYNWLRFGDVLETGYGAEARAYTTPFFTGLYGLLLSPGKGLVWYDPPLLLALAASVWFARRRPALAVVILGMFAATVALYARYYAWYGGGVWGPRFLVPLLPLLLLPAGDIIERAWRPPRQAASPPVAHQPSSVVPRVALLTVAALSLFVTALGIIVPFDRYVMEVNASPETLKASFWDIEDSPLVVHAERLDDSLTSPDIAAERYGSRRLAAISLAAGLVGVAALARAIRGVRELRAEG
jgi:hypothetical protein